MEPRVLLADISFSAGVLAVGERPLGVATADFDGDGKKDLAVANANSDSVSVMLGQGDGSFGPRQDLAVGDYPVSIAVGDFNGDGKSDMAVANYYGSSCLSILLGNGDGTFEPSVTFGSILRPKCVAVGDFNGDGKSDLVTGVYRTAIWLGNGDGTFADGVNVSVGGASVVSIAVGDFNGDGKQDMATASEATTAISVLLGNGDGSFSSTSYPVGATSQHITAADFDGDGKSDLAVAVWGGANVSVLRGNDDGTFQARVSYAVGSGPVFVGASDFNDDGKSDLVVGNLGGNVGVLAGDGAGGFGAMQGSAWSTSIDGMVVDDFNGDGKADVATVSAPSNSVTVLMNRTNTHAPEELTLSGASLLENAPGGTVVGSLGTTDQDWSDSFTYSLVEGEGSADNALFQIVSGQLQAIAGLDHESQSAWSVRIRTEDSGGLWLEKAFAISVVDVNEAPSFVGGGDVAVSEDEAYPGAAWATAISAGAGENGATMAFEITGNTNPSLFSAGPAIAVDGTLSFTLAANAWGSAELTVVLIDGGGTENGGVDRTAPLTFAIVVSPVPDAPVAVNDVVALNEDTSVTAAPLGNDTDADAGETLSVIAITRPAHGSAVLNGDGTIRYTPDWDYRGSDSLQYTLRDSSGLEATGTVSFTVNPVAEPATLKISGGSARDVIGLSLEGGRFKVLKNGKAVYYALSRVGGIVVDALGGNDTVTVGVGVKAVTLKGGDGSDSLVGGSGSDSIDGGAGNDTLKGGAGNDRMYGQAGLDRLYGGSGNDLINAGSGDDRLYGESGDDRLYGGTGDDALSGGVGTDWFYGQEDDDIFYAKDLGKDYFTGGAGRDTAYWDRASDIRLDRIEVLQ